MSVSPDGGTVAPTVAAACATHAVPTQPLRRLSSTQFRNTLVDLFGAPLAASTQAGSLFPATVITHGFSGDSEANSVNTSQSNAIEDEAERIASRVIAAPDPWLRALLPCPMPTTIADAQIDGCIDAFVAGFGLRAFRRPVTDSETKIARGVYDAIRPSQGAAKAFASVLQFFVESPPLLYRVERGSGPVADRPGLVALTGYELASRLSFLFADSGPDAELLDAASKGALASPDQIEAHARRLMSLPRFQDALAAFHRDWLHLYENAAKDPARYPTYTPAVQASLAEEPAHLLKYVLEQGDGSLKSLLGASEMPVNATLADYYGVSAPGATADHWVPVAVPNRRGLLTLASVQTALARSITTTPIHRGNFLRTSVLCEPALMLPAKVDTATPLAGAAGAATARGRLDPLMTRPDCMGCHKQFNPIGLGLENYDGVGLWRDKENGETIDASGEVDLGAATPLGFKGPGELVTLMSSSDKVQQCYALQWFRSSVGRSETPEDQCSIAAVQSTVVKSKGDLRELLVALTRTDAFLYRKAAE